MHVYTSELVRTRVDACGFGGTVENKELAQIHKNRQQQNQKLPNKGWGGL